MPSSLGGLLKSGFGLFGLQARPSRAHRLCLQAGLTHSTVQPQAKPKPGDADVALLFVLGGVGAGELRDAREAAAIAAAAQQAAASQAQPGDEAEPLELLLGGTRLLTPDALAHLMFA